MQITIQGLKYKNGTSEQNVQDFCTDGILLFMHRDVKQIRIE